MKRMLVVTTLIAVGVSFASCSKKCKCQEWLNGEKEGKHHKERTLLITNCADLGDYRIDENGKKQGVQCCKSFFFFRQKKRSN